MLGVLVVLLGTRWAVSAELPTAKPAEVGLDPDKIRKAREAVHAQPRPPATGDQAAD
jgi:hypothetical protein